MFPIIVYSRNNDFIITMEQSGASWEFRPAKSQDGEKKRRKKVGKNKLKFHC
jgi:hypothetical protein